jgi:hypothetical protein
VDLSERGFSKLTPKLPENNYVRRELSGPAAISVENKVAMKLKSERLLNDFISMKASVYPLYNII